MMYFQFFIEKFTSHNYKLQLYEIILKMNIIFGEKSFFYNDSLSDLIFFVDMI